MWEHKMFCSAGLFRAINGSQNLMRITMDKGVQLQNKHQNSAKKLGILFYLLDRDLEFIDLKQLQLDIL